MNPIPAGISLDQIGIVVRDLRATIEALHHLFGIGPFRAMEWPIEGINPESTYHGKPGHYRMLLGFSHIGQTQVELIQPLEGQNIWTDFLESRGPGLHHIRFTVPDFEERVATLEAAGIENIASGAGAHIGSKWAYFDTTKLLDGIVIELRKRMDDVSGEGQWATAGIELGG
jgi:catechol 2,3-dioxygenase-like lactoylglutathione lyase family enzyme